MAIDPSDTYSPTQIDTSDPVGYPRGAARNDAIPGDRTGTPLEKEWMNDLWGFEQAALAEAGATPSGTPDKVGASQYLDALKLIQRRQVALANFGTWASTNFVGTNQRLLRALGRHPLTGRTYCVRTDTGTNLNELFLVRADGATTNTTQTLGVSSEAVSFAVSDDAFGNGPGLFVTGLLASPYRLGVWGMNYSGDLETLAGATGSVSLGYAPALSELAYDAEHGALIGAAYYDARTPSLFRVVDSATPAIAAASSTPSLSTAAVQSNATRLAVGGGRAIFMYSRGTATAFACYTSTDGGDTWTSTGAPTTPAGDNEVLGVGYFAENFYAVIRGAAYNEIKVYRSPTGATWTLILDATWHFDVPQAAFVEGFLALVGEGVTLTDLVSLETWATDTARSGTTYMVATDGARLLTGTNTTTDEGTLSAMLVPPRSFTPA